MITKTIFRTEVKNILLEYMLAGSISPGKRLSLAKIARDLDVSVTPIREALTQLSETGLVTYKANRGFFVTDLSEKEAIEIYELIAILEGTAIKNTDYKAEQLADLQDINRKFKAAKNSKEKLRLDRNFHQKLIEGYSNTYAQKLIEDIRIRVFIYEFEFMNIQADSASADMHDRIIETLLANKKSSAIKELESNWEISIHHIVKSYKKKSYEQG